MTSWLRAQARHGFPVTLATLLVLVSGILSGCTTTSSDPAAPPTSSSAPAPARPDNPQALKGAGWRWLATSADDSLTFLRPLTTEQELNDFWSSAANAPTPIDADQPTIDFDKEFVLVLSTRGRNTKPGPCGIYFRGLRADHAAKTVTVRFEKGTLPEGLGCWLAYAAGQYVIAVEWDFAGQPPFDILIDEPGQAGQPNPVQVDG